MSEQQSSNSQQSANTPSFQNTEPESHDDIVYVGFWLRLIAFIVDSLAVGIIMMPVVLLAVFSFEGSTAKEVTQNAQSMGIQMLLIQWGLPVIFTLAFWFWKCATPGKMVFDAMIVDAKTLEAPTKGQLIGRYFAYIPSGLIFFLGYIWVAFDGRKQGWHDKMAGTVVIKKPA